MKLGLINSAWAQAGKDTAWGIQKTKEIGFDCIDIFADPFDIDIRERLLIKRECDKAELPIVSVCCVAVGLIDFNPSVRRFHLERCIAYLDMCYEYEAKNLLLVLGEYIWNREVIPPDEQWRYGVETCRELAEYAADLGAGNCARAGTVSAVVAEQCRFDGPICRRSEPSRVTGQYRCVASAPGRNRPV